MNTISNVDTALPQTSMMKYYGSKEGVAQFVTDLLHISEFDYAWITIMPPGKFGEFYVRVVTDLSWEDTVRTKAQTYSLTLIDISLTPTQVS